MRELPVVTQSSRKEKGPAPDAISEAPATNPWFASKQAPQVRAKLVSATVYLLPDQLALIKQHCADTNRRISDLISEAVDDYLRKPR